MNNINTSIDIRTQAEIDKQNALDFLKPLTTKNQSTKSDVIEKMNQINNINWNKQNDNILNDKLTNNNIDNKTNNQNTIFECIEEDSASNYSK